MHFELRTQEYFRLTRRGGGLEQAWQDATGEPSLGVEPLGACVHRKRGTAATAAFLVVAMAAPANSQVLNDVIAATISNQVGRGDPCKNMVAFDKLPLEQQDLKRRIYGSKVDEFWALAKTDPKAAAKLVHGGKKGGLKGLDGVVRPAGSSSMLHGVVPLNGPYTMVKVTHEALGQASRGVWKSAAVDGREVLQTVDFKVNFWTMGNYPMVIHRIAITEVANAPVTPDVMCSMAREAPPLW